MISRWFFVCLVACMTACDGGGSAADAGKPKPSFDPTPEGATRIDLGAVLGADRVLLADVTQANFERRSGDLFLAVEGHVFVMQLICSDFGCINIWTLEGISFCWKIEGVTATKSTLCTKANYRTVLLSGTQDAGTYELLGSATIEVPVAEEFSSWVGREVVRSSPVHFRLSVRDGALVAPPLLQRSPDEVPLIDGLMPFQDEGTMKLTWRNRDDTVFAVDTSVSALSGRLLGNGVFGLGWNAPFFPEGAHTAAAALLSDTEWLGLFVTPSYESAGDHGSATGGGPLLNLWLRRGKPESTTAAPLTHFTGLEATTASSNTVDVCFNRQLDPASVPTAAISVEGLEVKSWSLLPGGQCLVVNTGQQSRAQSYAVNVAGLRSLSGEALATGGQRLSFLPDEGRATDLLDAFNGYKPGSSLGGDAIFYPLKSGAVLLKPSQGRSFQEGDGFFLTGADVRSLINLSARYEAQGYHVERAYPGPPGDGVWLAFTQQKPGLVFVDGELEQLFPAMMTQYPQVLGDGTAVVRQLDGTWLRLLKNGATEPYLGTATTYVVTGAVANTTDALVQNGVALEFTRMNADGGVVGAPINLTGVAPYVAADSMLFDLGTESII